MHRRLGAVLLPFAALAWSACAPTVLDSESTASDTKASSARELLISSPPTTMPCPEAHALNASNAVWLAWLAANSYAHLEALAPALESLGFGQVGDGAAWVADYQRLEQARDAGDPAVAQLEADLIRTVHYDRMIDFFSGGAVLSSDGVQLFSKGTTQVTWAQHRTLPIVVIAFRGTEVDEKADLFTDANLLKTTGPLGGRVHEGFTRAVTQVARLLEKRLQALPQGTLVYLTGHSLGGALATEFAAREFATHPDGSAYALRGIYEFGSPRVGNSDYVSAFNKAAAARGVQVFRFEHQNDAIATLPPAWLGYEHVGAPVELRADTVLHAPDAAPDGSTTDDHPVLLYYGKLTRLLTQQPAYPFIAQGDFAGLTLPDLYACR